jgi:hypothetical protein
MIVHNVIIGKQVSGKTTARDHKKMYVGCAESDVRYRDMLVNFRHRWELYSEATIDFLTFDRKGMKRIQCKSIIEQTIRGVDGVMMIVSAQTLTDPLALWEIDCSVSHNIPIVGVDIGKNSEENIPKSLVGKMTKYGWEWFAEFINGL